MTELVPTADPRPLGRSGISVSPVAWGMWRFAGRGTAEARVLVEAALAAGVTLFDTADVYGMNEGGFGEGEALLGRVLAEAPDRRDRMVIATKGGIVPPVPYDSSPRYLAAALDASLRRLGVERVDLYQIHRPDILTHPQEVARTLEDMVSAGKVGAIGVSNHSVAQVQALGRFLTVPLATVQPEFSALHLAPLTDGVLDHAMAHDIAPLAWSPLGGGRIAAPVTAREQAVAAALDRKAAATGVGRTAAACAWLMAHPARAIPILGTQDPRRLGEIADIYRVRWTRAEWYEVLVASRGERLP